MEAPENEAPENQVPVPESQTASENADINVGVSTPAVIHFAYLGSINNIIDIDGIDKFPGNNRKNDTGILTCSWRWGKQRAF